MATKKELKAYARLVGGLLNARGAGLKNIDSNDKAMQEAIRQVQVANGLKATGRADAKTLAVLQAPVAPLRGSASIGGGTGASVSGKVAAVDPNPIVPGEFAEFSPAIQANAAKYPNVAQALRGIQHANAIEDADNRSARFDDRAAAAAATPERDPALSRDFSIADPQNPGAFGPDTTIEQHNQAVGLQEALQARVQALRDSAIDTTPGQPFILNLHPHLPPVKASAF